MVHHSEIKSQGACENDYKKHRLNGVECFYLVDGHIAGWVVRGDMKEKIVEKTCVGAMFEF